MDLLAASPDCVKLLDAGDGSVRLINENGLKLLQLENAEAVCGHVWSDLWPEAERANLTEAVQVARDGGVGRFTGYAPLHNGTPRWWDVTVSPIRNRSDRVTHLLVISRDITAHKSMEAVLGESERRFRALADNIAQFAWMADGGGNLFWYNQRWLDFTGIASNEEMLRTGWPAFHHPDHIDRVKKKYEDAISSGVDWEDTFPLRGAGGSYRWFLSRARPIRDDSGRVLLWCGTNTDITDERSSVERLRQKARLIELSHEAIMMWDFHSGIVLWNRGCEELYGYTRAEALEQLPSNLLRINHPLPLPEFEDMLRAEGSWTGEIGHTAKDGSQVWVDSRQELVRYGGRTIVLETNRDITERRRADELRTLLIGELNHRVKNTLAIVQSIATQTARSSTDIGAFIDRFTGRLQSMSSAHNLLTDTHWTGASLSNVIRTQLGIDSAIMERVLMSGPDVTLPAQTALHLSLLLYELATNAQKYGALSTPSGRLEVTWTVEPGDQPKLRLVWREVGGPPVEPPAARGFGTTLINRAGNQPNLTTELKLHPDGAVCTMVATLPREALKEQAYFNPGGRRIGGACDTEQSGRQQLRAKSRVLIVEDEPLIAMDMETHLVEAGFATLGPAASVDEALKMIEAVRFDVAILDGNLLGEPVDAVADALKCKGIPFVFVTGFSRSTLPPGYDDYEVVSKPVGRRSLIEAVCRHLKAPCSGVSASS